MQTQYNAHVRLFFGAEVLFVVSVAQERQRYAVRAEGRLNDIRHIASVRLRVEIGEVLAGMLLMAGEVIVRAVCNAPKLSPAEREQILNIRRRLGVEGELLLAVVAQADVRFVQTEVQKPVFAEIFPVVEPVEVRARLTEEFALHLLKLANTENEVARGDLISEALAHLTNAERHLLARGALNAREVDKNALCSLRAEVQLALCVFRNTLERLEHQVELADVRKVVAAAFRAGNVVVGDELLHLLVRPTVCGFAGEVFNELIGTMTGLAVLAVHQRIGEAAHVTGRHPDFRVHEDCGIQRHVVAALLHELALPRVFYVVLEKAAQRAVVPRVGQTAVNFGAGVYVASVFAERHDFFHGLFFGLQNFLHLLNSFRAAGCCTASCSWMLRL